MRKIYFAFAIIVLTASSKSFAQDKPLAYTKGTSTISGSYGFINVWKTLLELYSSEKIKATGPFVATYEYGISKKISAGISVGYTNVKDDYTDEFANWFFVARGSYHFKTSSKLDPYVGAGFGYYNFKFTSDYITLSVPVFHAPTALAFTGEVGAKYYFYPKFAAYAEVGYVDGSIIKLGATFKIK